MLNYLTINVSGTDLTEVTGLELRLVQDAGGVKNAFSGESLEVKNSSQVIAAIPRSVCEKLKTEHSARGQLLFLRDGVPDRTRVFEIPIDELLPEGGYGPES